MRWGVTIGLFNSHWDTVVKGNAFSMIAEGELTATYDQAAHSFLSTDKKLMVSTTVRKDAPWSGFIYTMTLDMKRSEGISYQPSDLTGTWQGNYLVSGGVWLGWIRSNLVVGSSGATTLSNIVKSDGTTDAHAGTFLISSAGDMTLSGDRDFKGYMNGDKNLWIANMKDGGGGAGLLVAQKVVSGVSSAMADLSGKLQFHRHQVGAESYTEHEELSIDANGKITYAKLVRDNGTSPALPRAATATVACGGVVVMETDYNGFMSADKKLMVCTKGNNAGGNYTLAVYQKMS